MRNVADRKPSRNISLAKGRRMSVFLQISAGARQNRQCTDDMAKNYAIELSLYFFTGCPELIPEIRYCKRIL